MHLQSLHFRSINARNKKIAVFFNGFWPDFDEKDNQILDFLNASSKQLNLLYYTSKDIQSSDILVESCYGPPLLSKCEHLTKILFLGENVRPFFSNYDYSISFDRSSYGLRNIDIIHIFNQSNRFFNPLRFGNQT